MIAWIAIAVGTLIVAALCTGWLRVEVTYRDDDKDG